MCRLDQNTVTMALRRVFYSLSLSTLTHASFYINQFEYCTKLILPGSLACVLFGTLLVLTPSQFHTSLMSQGKLELYIATAAEARKREKCALLSKSHRAILFQLQLRPKVSVVLSLLTDISRHQQSITHDQQSLSFLLQSVHCVTCSSLCIGHLRYSI